MPIVFEKGEYLRIKDIQRCPFVPREQDYISWIREDDKRQLLTALDRYAISLICKHSPVRVSYSNGYYVACLYCDRRVYF